MVCIPSKGQEVNCRLSGVNWGLAVVTCGYLAGNVLCQPQPAHVPNRCPRVFCQVPCMLGLLLGFQQTPFDVVFCSNWWFHSEKGDSHTLREVEPFDLWFFLFWRSLFVLRFQSETFVSSVPNGVNLPSLGASLGLQRVWQSARYSWAHRCPLLDGFCAIHVQVGNPPSVYQEVCVGRASPSWNPEKYGSRSRLKQKPAVRKSKP